MYKNVVKLVLPLNVLLINLVFFLVFSKWSNLIMSHMVLPTSAVPEPYLAFHSKSQAEKMKSTENFPLCFVIVL